MEQVQAEDLVEAVVALVRLVVEVAVGVYCLALAVLVVLVVLVQVALEVVQTPLVEMARYQMVVVAAVAVGAHQAVLQLVDQQIAAVEQAVKQLH
jgi:hypothetical protein